MQLQGQGSDDQESERRQQGEPIRGLYRLHHEDAFQRGQNERASHQPREERIKHDQDAPLEFHFVRVHEAFNRNLQQELLIAPSHPSRSKTASSGWPSKVLGLARREFSKTHESDRWDSSGQQAGERRSDSFRSRRS